MAVAPETPRWNGKDSGRQAAPSASVMPVPANRRVSRNSADSAIGRHFTFRQAALVYCTGHASPAACKSRFVCTVGGLPLFRVSGRRHVAH